MTDHVLQDIVRSFSGVPVLVVGDVMLDEYIWGEVRRISPEAPVPIVEVQRRTYVPGGAANAAANVAGLGAQALLAGVIGPDAPGQQLGISLRELGVSPEGLVTDAGRTTTTKTRIIAHIQQVARIDAENRHPLSAAAEERLLRWVAGCLPHVRGCLLSDYAKGVLASHVTLRIIQLARAAGRPVVVDPKGTDYSKYRGATVVKPNLHETERVLKREIHGEKDLLESGAQLMTVLSGTSILITRGPDGMTLFQEGAQPLHIRSAAQNVFDVTGAGDTVASTLAVALAAGARLDEAAEIANRAAGIVVGKVGTTAVTRDELLAELE